MPLYVHRLHLMTDNSAANDNLNSDSDSFILQTDTFRDISSLWLILSETAGSYRCLVWVCWVTQHSRGCSNTEIANK